MTISAQFQILHLFCEVTITFTKSAVWFLAQGAKAHRAVVRRPTLVAALRRFADRVIA